MITADDLIEIGYFSRSHGINGKIDVVLTVEWIEDELPTNHIFVERDGCFIPFRVEESGYFGRGYQMKISGVETKEEAEAFEKQTIYLMHRDVEDIVEEAEADNLEGYMILDEVGNEIGVIDYVDDSTENVLFYLETDGEDPLIIPAVDEWVVEIDDENETITMAIPEGLLDINKPGTRCVDDEE